MDGGRHEDCWTCLVGRWRESAADAGRALGNVELVVLVEAAGTAVYGLRR